MRGEASEAGDRLHRRLAGLLGVGTWVSCALIAAGMASSAAGAGQAAAGRHLVMAGIALLIGLPTLGVATIGLWFGLKRDPAFALVAALVLTIIVASTLLGLAAA